MKFRRRHPNGQMTLEGSRNQRALTLVALPAASQRKREAFTLVELLVVIGIIALLISILLPALSAARKQAATVKCAASLRDIGNAFLMYVQDNNGWAPPAKCIGGPYNLSTGNFTAGQPAFWFNFLAKYETKTAMGNAATTGDQASSAQGSIFWACPSWSGYVANGTSGISGGITNVGGIALTQTGFGMNGFPEYTPSWPPKNITLGETTPVSSPLAVYVYAVNTPVYSATSGWTPPASGKWYKWVTYSHLGSDRALVGDCLFWFMEARSPMTPPAMAAQYTLSNNVTWASEDGNNETTFDYYRHGTYPKLKSGTSDEFDPNGGKVRFNVLFCDNHVQTLTDRGDAYKVVRMRYPG